MTKNFIWFGVVMTILFFGALHSASAATNVSSTYPSYFAWNDTIGWIDFYNQGASNATVSATTVTGSNVSSSVGVVSLDCASAPWGCTYPYGVTNDGSGNLGGWAWNNDIGWIAFYWGNPTSNPSSAASSTRTSVCKSYGSQCGVYIDQYGNLYGYAWNDAVGWISFNCNNLNASCPPNYEVATTWTPTSSVGMLDSATFDTGISTGVELNSVMWHGSLNGLATGAVAFQFAASNSSSGPWTTFTGPGGTATTTYSGNPDTPISITNYSTYAGYRYFRYRIILTTDIHQSVSPKVTGVSVDWSP